MNKILKYALAAVMAVCFAVPVATKAEAATVAVVPLIVNENVEDEQGMKAILFSDAVAKTFPYPEYEMVSDTDLVRQAALAQQDKLFTKEGLIAVANASKADIVVAMSIEKFVWTENRYLNSPVTTCDFRGKFVTYNKLTDKFKSDNWIDDAERETESISPREDWPHKEFGRFCRRELQKAVKK